MLQDTWVFIQEDLLQATRESESWQMATLVSAPTTPLLSNSR